MLQQLQDAGLMKQLPVSLWNATEDLRDALAMPARGIPMLHALLDRAAVMLTITEHVIQLHHGLPAVLQAHAVLTPAAFTLIVVAMKYLSVHLPALQQQQQQPGMQQEQPAARNVLLLKGTEVVLAAEQLVATLGKSIFALSGISAALRAYPQLQQLLDSADLVPFLVLQLAVASQGLLVQQPLQELQAAAAAKEGGSRRGRQTQRTRSSSSVSTTATIEGGQFLIQIQQLQAQQRLPPTTSCQQQLFGLLGVDSITLAWASQRQRVPYSITYFQGLLRLYREVVMQQQQEDEGGEEEEEEQGEEVQEEGEGDGDDEGAVTQWQLQLLLPAVLLSCAARLCKPGSAAATARGLRMADQALLCRNIARGSSASVHVWANQSGVAGVSCSSSTDELQLWLGELRSLLLLELHEVLLAVPQQEQEEPLLRLVSLDPPADSTPALAEAAADAFLELSAAKRSALAASADAFADVGVPAAPAVQGSGTVSRMGAASADADTDAAVLARYLSLSAAVRAVPAAVPAVTALAGVPAVAAPAAVPAVAAPAVITACTVSRVGDTGTAQLLDGEGCTLRLEVAEPREDWMHAAGILIGMLVLLLGEQEDLDTLVQQQDRKAAGQQLHQQQTEAAPAGEDGTSCCSSAAAGQQQQQQCSGQGGVYGGGVSSTLPPALSVSAQLPLLCATFERLVRMGAAAITAEGLAAYTEATEMALTVVGSGCIASSGINMGVLTPVVQQAGLGRPGARQFYSFLCSLVKLCYCVSQRSVLQEGSMWSPVRPACAAMHALYLEDGQEGEGPERTPTLDALPSVFIIGRCCLLWADILSAQREDGGLALQESQQCQLRCCLHEYLSGLWIVGKTWLPARSAQLSAAGYPTPDSWLQVLLVAKEAADAAQQAVGEAVAVQSAVLVQHLRALGRASCLFAVPVCCNNPRCMSLQGETEVSLVSGRACVCGGCKIARYCGRECLRQHWKQHKPVCKAMAAAAAGAAAVAGGSDGDAAAAPDAL
jgi:hypothetical protein